MNNTNKVTKYFSFSSVSSGNVKSQLEVPSMKKKAANIFRIRASTKETISPPCILPTDTKELEDKIHGLEEIIRQKDLEIVKMRGELEKLRSVVKSPMYAETLRQVLQKQTVQDDSTAGTSESSKHHKDNSTSKKMMACLDDNIYMKNLEKDQLAEIVASFHLESFPKDTVILKEGESSDYLFLVEEGMVELSRAGETIGTLPPGKMFGEHSFLYSCIRTTSVKALTDSKVWVLSKQAFEGIMIKSIMMKQRDYLELLNKVPLFKEIPDFNLCKIIDILKEVQYPESTYVYHQGERGDTLFIIKKGTVEFSRKATTQADAQFVKLLCQGAFFGEKSLLGEESYAHDARAGRGGCLLLQIEREAFSTFIGTISGLKSDLKSGEAVAASEIPSQRLSIDSRSSTISSVSDLQTHSITSFKAEYLRRITLDELHTVYTLGVGKLSRTELVVPKSDPRVFYALKQMVKKTIVANGFQPQVISERKILSELNSSFIVKLFKTFKDRKYVYMLMEASLGGSLRKMINDRKGLPENWAKFYIGCVIEGLRYLHKMGIIFRDLKPENVLLDDRGYCKLINLTYAKKLQFGRRTYSFCGTPEYVAPEVILNKGHDYAVDYWGIGIILYETLVGSPPFVGADPIKTYNIIMRGFDAVGFPTTVSKTIQNLIGKLCKLNPNERLGYAKNNISEVQKHKWFESFNWVNLRNLVMDPPFVPKIRDVSENYDDDDEFPRDDEIPPDEMSGWDKEF